MHHLQGGAIFHHPHLNPQGSPYHTAALSEAFRNPHFGSPGIPNFGPLPRPAGTPNPTQTPIQFGFDRGSQHQTPILGAHIHQYQQQLGVSPAGGGVMVTPPFTPANNLPHFAAFQQLQLQQQSLLGASPAAMQGGNGGNPPGPTEGPSPNNLHPVQPNRPLFAADLPSQRAFPPSCLSLPDAPPGGSYQGSGPKGGGGGSSSNSSTVPPDLIPKEHATTSTNNNNNTKMNNSNNAQQTPTKPKPLSSIITPHRPRFLDEGSTPSHPPGVGQNNGGGGGGLLSSTHPHASRRPSSSSNTNSNYDSSPRILSQSYSSTSRHFQTTRHLSGNHGGGGGNMHNGHHHNSSDVHRRNGGNYGGMNRTELWVHHQNGGGPNRNGGSVNGGGSYNGGGTNNNTTRQFKLRPSTGGGPGMTPGGTNERTPNGGRQRHPSAGAQGQNNGGGGQNIQSLNVLSMPSIRHSQGQGSGAPGGYHTQTHHHHIQANSPSSRKKRHT